MVLHNTFVTLFSSFLVVAAPKWTVLTASLTEMNAWKLFITLPLILVCAVPLEELWSSRELFNFISFSITISGLTVWVLSFFACFSHNIAGAMALVIPLSVGFRHALPYQEVVNCNRYLPTLLRDRLPGRGIVQARHVPFICVVGDILAAVIFPASFSEWPLAVTSFVTSWVYIRYMMWFPYTNIRGDHSNEFSFSFLFPKIIRPYVEKLTGSVIYPIFVRLLGNRLELRATSEITSLYAPSDSVAATAAFTSLTGEPVCLGVHEDERSKALRDLDDRIAALTNGGTSTTCSSDVELASV